MSALGRGRVPPPCADDCRQVIVDLMAERGCEVNASWAPPTFPTAYEPFDMTCPHGVLWYAEPTTDQTAAWVREWVQ